MIGICSYGAYVPLLRMTKEAMGGFGTEERSVANFDEDSLTMAVEAARDCLVGIDRKTVDGLFLATTTAPLLEKQAASLAVLATSLPQETLTVDLTDSLRAGTNALRLACDAVKAGSSKKILVTAADCRMARPEAMLEQNIGDGAGALLIGSTKVIASIENSYSVSSAFFDQWRPAGDPFVHTWQDRFALNAGYTPIAKTAIAAAMKKFKIKPEDIAKAVYTAPDGRSHGNLGKALGFNAKQIQAPLFDKMGNTGAAFPIMLLVSALETAKEGDKILVASYGDGVDVLLLQVTSEIEKVKARRGMTGYLASKQMIASYMRYLRMRHMYPVELSRYADVVPGLAQLWREKESIVMFHGSKCNQCSWQEYPIRRICPNCLSKDDYTEVNLADTKATLFSFTTDSGPMVPNVTDDPMCRVIVDFKGGARLDGEMTDWGGIIEDLEVGIPLEMTFRKLERQGDIPAYSWKPRPVR